MGSMSANRTLPTILIQITYAVSRFFWKKVRFHFILYGFMYSDLSQLLDQVFAKKKATREEFRDLRYRLAQHIVLQDGCVTSSVASYLIELPEYFIPSMFNETGQFRKHAISFHCAMNGFKPEFMEYRIVIQDPAQVLRMKKIAKGVVRYYNSSKMILWDDVKKALYEQRQLRVWWTNILLRQTLICYVTPRCEDPEASYKFTEPVEIAPAGYDLFTTEEDLIRVLIELMGIIVSFELLFFAIIFIISRYTGKNEGYEELSSSEE
ncbi:hypothetical protein RF11_12526 [Thelohanellus kitauei]|uniref:Uncharacterized protein n=1 Tax=Thelohanellus kitauei TaxID=669202 RepID=A0A0C2M2H7_THEKT|nr:hypothetical protein RF11_12526 [Thelohanellus kitauei]